MQQAACSSCKAAKLCRSSEQKEKVIEVVTPRANHYQVGQEVTIVGSVSQGLQATLYAYVLPLMILLLCMSAASLRGAGDALAALFGLSIMALYYLVLFFLRSHLERKFSFTIEEGF